MQPCRCYRTSRQFPVTRFPSWKGSWTVRWRMMEARVLTRPLDWSRVTAATLMVGNHHGYASGALDRSANGRLIRTGIRAPLEAVSSPRRRWTLSRSVSVEPNPLLPGFGCLESISRRFRRKQRSLTANQSWVTGALVPGPRARQDRNLCGEQTSGCGNFGVRSTGASHRPKAQLETLGAPADRLLAFDRDSHLRAFETSSSRAST